MVRRRQTLGLVALILMLLSIVALAAIGQPLVAGVVAAPLTAVVAIFVTGQHRGESGTRGAPPSTEQELLSASAAQPDEELS